MTIELVLTCGFLSLGGLLLLLSSFLSNSDALFLLGSLLAAMGVIPLVIFWYHRVCEISNRYFSQKELESTNEEDPHENS